VSRSSRRPGVAAGCALPLVVSLAACSVPREADLGSASAPASPSPSPSLVVTPTPTPTPSASPTPTPTPTPTFARVKPPVPPAAAGYRLGPAPADVPNPLAGVKGANEVFGASTVRSVSRRGTPVGLVFRFAVRPQYLNDPQVIDAVVSRLAASIKRGGVPLTKQRFGKRQVLAGSSAKNGTIVLWYMRGVLSVVVGGGDPGAVTGYAKALVAAS
jgi:hypothetical protein